MRSKHGSVRSAKGVANRRARLKKLLLDKMESWLHSEGTRGRTPRPLLERFMEKVLKCPNGCWLWTGAVNQFGYAKLCVRDKMVNAGRISLFLHGVTPEPNKVVCHKCDKPECVNPEHLFWGTYKDNTQDALRKNRMLKGEKNGHSKLSQQQVLDIRARISAGEVRARLAEEFGVWPAAITRIIKRTRWRHI